MVVLTEASWSAQTKTESRAFMRFDQAAGETFARMNFTSVNHEKSAISKGLGDDRMECLGRGIAVPFGHGFGPGAGEVRALPGSLVDLLAGASRGDSLVYFRCPIWWVAVSRRAGFDYVGICGGGILTELSEQILAFYFSGQWASFLFACGGDARSHCRMSRLQNRRWRQGALAIGVTLSWFAS